MACESSTTHLLTGLSHAGLYNYNGRQIELFHMKWFVDRLTWPTSVRVYRISYKFNNNLRTSK